MARSDSFCSFRKCTGILGEHHLDDPRHRALLEEIHKGPSRRGACMMRSTPSSPSSRAVGKSPPFPPTQPCCRCPQPRNICFLAVTWGRDMLHTLCGEVLACLSARLHIFFNFIKCFRALFGFSGSFFGLGRNNSSEGIAGDTADRPSDALF